MGWRWVVGGIGWASGKPRQIQFCYNDSRIPAVYEECDDVHGRLGRPPNLVITGGASRSLSFFTLSFVCFILILFASFALPFAVLCIFSFAFALSPSPTHSLFLSLFFPPFRFSPFNSDFLPSSFPALSPCLIFHCHSFTFILFSSSYLSSST